MLIVLFFSTRLAITAIRFENRTEHKDRLYFSFYGSCTIIGDVFPNLILVRLPDSNPIRGSLPIHIVPLYKNWISILDSHSNRISEKKRLPILGGKPYFRRIINRGDQRFLTALFIKERIDFIQSNYQSQVVFC